MEWEKRLAEIIGEAKQAGVTPGQIKEIVDTLFMEG